MITTDSLAEHVNGPHGAAPSEERRRVPRHAHSRALTLSVFNQDRVFEGCMVDYSSEGDCAETFHYLRPGTSIHLRIDERTAAGPESAGCHCFRTTALGEVKWCRALEQDPARRYRIGIRYYSHY